MSTNDNSLEFGNILDGIESVEQDLVQVEENFEQLVQNVVNGNSLPIPGEDINVDDLPKFEADGVEYVIVDGNAIPLSVFLGDVEEIEPQAPAALSGGASAQPFVLGDIGPAPDLTELLPPTALQFPVPEEEEVFPGLEDDNPDVDIIPDDPVSSDPALDPVEALVDEVALPQGTNPTSNDEVTTGDLVVDTGNDELASLVINGIDVTNGGTVQGEYGVLTVFVDADGNYTWDYELTDNTIDHPDAGSTGTDEGVTDAFTVVVTDDDGDTATDSLVIGIVDDGPVAIDDAATADQGLPVVINVFENDTEGADGVDLSTVTFDDTNTAGDIVYNGDGTFTFTPDPGFEEQTTFTYTIVDGDGDTSTATVTIDGPPDSVPVIQPIVSEVDEAALDDGTNSLSNADTTSGDFPIDTGNDDIGMLVINGEDVTGGGTVTTDLGTLLVTENADGSYSWTYTLDTNTTDHLDTNSTGTSEGIQDLFEVVVTDSDGSTGETTLTINILDDGPIAEDDGNTATEGGSAVSGNVVDNDTIGADNDSFTATLDSPAVGTHGTLVLNADGSYTYTPNDSVPAGSTDSFTYTLTDADGDTDTAVLTFTFEGDNNVPSAVADSSVLSDVPGDDSTAGSNADGFVPQSDTGDLQFDFGLDGAGGFVSAAYDDGLGAATTSSSGGITTIAADDGSWTLEINETTGEYLFTQNTAYDHDLNADSDGAVVTVTIEDSDGSQVAVDITLTINDDVPLANDDGNTATEGGMDVSGNVLANDDIGADHGTVGTDSTVSLDSPAVGTHGTLVLNADGSYTYTPNDSVPAGSTDSFTYTLTDADGDTDTAVLTFTFEGDNNVPSAVADSSVLSDVPGDDSTAGSNADGFVPQSDTGDLQFDFGLDGAGGFVSAAYDDGLGAATTSSSGGITTIAADDGSWTLEINETTGEYLFTQNTAYDHDLNADSDGAVVTVTIEDSDGSQVAVDITLTINDDVPLANDDGNTATEGGMDVSGNVLANDDIGADHGTVGTDSTVSLDSPAVGTHGTLVLNADGSYTYTPNDSVPAGSTDSFTYTLTDADGDTDTAVLTFTFEGDNNVPSAVADSSVLSDVPGDDSTAGSNADGFVPQSDTGDLQFDFGLDGAGGFVSAAYDDGLGAATTSSSGGITTIAADDGSWTLEINETTGEYLFTQNTAYDHDLNADSDGAVVTVTIEDSDGSQVAVDITLTINDDVPLANDDAETTIEGGSAIIGDVLANDDIGADHGTVGVDSQITDIDSDNLGTDGDIGAPIMGEFGTLTINADGTYSYVPNASVPSGSEDVFTYELTDADGDVTTATLTFNFDGDANAPTAGVTEALADEDDLAAGIGDDANGDNDSFGLTGTLTHDYGLDGAGSITLLGGSEVVNGVTYTYTVGTDINGDQVLTANDGSQDVFTLTLTDDVAGTYEIELLASVDHLGTNPGFEDDLLFSLGYQVKDSDDTTVDGTFEFTVDDDIPVEVEGALPVVAVDEDELTGGITDNDAVGTVSTDGDVSSLVDFGADQPGEFGLFTDTSGLAAQGLESNGILLTYNVSGNTLTATAGDGGPEVFTLVMNTDGTFTFTLQDQIDHPNMNGDDNEILFFDVGSIISASDSDGDTIGFDQPIIVRIEDDVPEVMDDAQSQIGEDNPITVNVFANDDGFGADGGDIDADLDLVPGSLTGAGSLVDNGDGTFTYTPIPGETGTVQFQYTLTDGDGDVATATVVLTLGDDSVPSVLATDTVVDEDGLVDANVDENPLLGTETDSTESATDSGTITVQYGNDTPADLLAAITLSDAGLDAQLDALGADVTWTLSGNGLTLTGASGGTTVLEIEITGATDNGGGEVVYDYTVTLSEELTHLVNDNEDSLVLNDVGFTVTDSDSDSQSGSFDVTIVDDVPTANDDTDSTGEDTQIVVDVLANDDVGADAPIIVTGATLDTVGAGSVSFDAGGDITFTPTAGFEGDAVITYTIEDADGDESTASLTVTVAPDSEPSVEATDTVVDEDGLVDANVDENPLLGTETDSTESATDSGTITVQYGNDTPADLLAAITLSDAGLDAQLDALGADVTWTLSGNGLTLTGASGGTTVLEIEITGATDNGGGEVVYDYTVTLSEELTHLVNDNEDSLVLNDVGFTVTDSDSDSQSGSFDVTIVDDVPTANDDTDSTGEDTQIVVDVLANDDVGADAPIIVTGATLDTVGAGSVSFDAGGDITFTPTAGFEGDAVITYTIEDADGDESTASLTVTVAPDSEPSVEATDTVVDEDGLVDANVDENPLLGTETDSTESATDSGTITVQYGNDTPADLLAAITLSDAGLDAQLDALGADVTWTLSGNGLTLTGASGGTTVLEIEITGATDNGGGEVVYDYTVTLSEELTHLVNDNEDSLVLNDVGFTVTDSDSDSQSGSFDVTIVDDVPTANDDTDSTGEDTQIVVDVLANDDVGADAPIIVTGATLDTVGAGSVSFDAGGDITFTPTAGFEGDAVITYTIEDADGDESTASLTVTVAPDSEPSVEATDTVVDEDGLVDANVDENPLLGTETDSTESATDSGTITVQYGNDTPADLLAAITLSDAGLDAQLDALGADVTWTLSGNGLTLTGASGGTTVLEIEITGATDNGGGEVVYDYTVTLSEELTHLVNDNEDSLVLNDVGFTVTDSDSDSQSGSFDVTIVDDVPTANDDTDSTGEDTQIVVDVLANDDVGADAPIIVTGATLDTVGAGSVSFDAGGDITFTPTAGFEGDAVITYTIEDADGDESTASLTVTVAPDSEPSVEATDTVVDEDGLVDANVDENPLLGTETDSTESATDSGTITVQYGNDTPADLLAAITLSDAGLDAQLDALGADVTWTLSGNGLTLTGASGGTTVLEIEITGATDNGGGEVVYDYTVTLSEELTHLVNDNEDSLVLNDVGFTVTDSDSDSQSGSFDVTIVDDVPTANDDTDSTGEDTQIVVDVLANDDVGADAPIIVTGATLDTVGAGSVSFDAGGDITFTPTAGFEGDAVITYTIEDADGDESTASLTVTVAPDSEPSVEATDTVVDEDGLVDANVDENPLLGTETDSTESATDSGTITVQYGNDTPADLLAAITLSDAGLDAQLDALGADVTWTLSGNGLTLTGASGGTTVLEIEITGATDNGGGEVVYDYTVTLSEELTHLVNDNEDSLVLNDVGFTVTDSDSDSQSGSFDVTIVDDVPQNFTPDALVTDNDGTGSDTDDLNLQIGADQPGTAVFVGTGTDVPLLGSVDGGPEGQLTSGGDPIVLNGFGTDTLTATADGQTVFVATLNPGADTYTITWSAEIDNGASLDFTGLGFTQAGNPRFQTTDGPDNENGDSQDLLFSTFGNSDPFDAETVNTDSSDVSVANQGAGTEDGEGIRIDFVLNGTVQGSNFNSNEYEYDSHYNANGFQFTMADIGNSGTTDAVIRVYDAPDNDPDNGTSTPTDHSDALATGASQDTITEIRVNGEVLDLTGVATSSDGVFVTTNSDGDYVVNELETGDIVQVFTADGYNRIEIENDSEAPNADPGDGFSIRNFGLLTEESGGDVTFSLDVAAQDADGDTTNTSEIDVTLTLPSPDQLPISKSSAQEFDGTIKFGADLAEMTGDGDFVEAEFARAEANSLMDMAAMMTMVAAFNELSTERFEYTEFESLPFETSEFMTAGTEAFASVADFNAEFAPLFAPHLMMGEPVKADAFEAMSTIDLKFDDIDGLNLIGAEDYAAIEATDALENIVDAADAFDDLDLGSALQALPQHIEALTEAGIAPDMIANVGELMPGLVDQLDGADLASLNEDQLLEAFFDNEIDGLLAALPSASDARDGFTSAENGDINSGQEVETAFFSVEVGSGIESVTSVLSIDDGHMMMFANSITGA